MVGPYPSIDELLAEGFESFGANPNNLTFTQCSHGNISCCLDNAGPLKDNLTNALAEAGDWASRPNLVWSLIHFVMHNQPAPMSSEAVEASRALAGALSQNFYCNDCRGFFTIGVLSEYGLPPESPDGEAHARYWNFGHNVASEHVATTRGGHPWIDPLSESLAANVANPFYVPYGTSKRMWKVDALTSGPTTSP